MLTRSVTDNNEWFGITGVLVTYENALYVSTVSVTPHGDASTICCDFKSTGAVTINSSWALGPLESIPNAVFTDW